MKKSVSWLLTALLLFGCLAGCGAEKKKAESLADGTSEAADSTEADPVYRPENRPQACFRNHFVETEAGCYDQVENLILFCPQGSDTFYPLCSKPNCQHKDENCNAWCGVAFGWYDGALYTVNYDGLGGKFDVVRRNPDGTGHETVAHVDAKKGGGFAFTFHNGKLYVYMSANLALPLEEQAERLLVVDLRDWSQAEPFTEYLQAGNRIGIIDYYKDKLYAYVENVRDPQAEPGVVEMDAATGAVRRLVSFQLGACYATDDTFFYLEPDVGFREYDLQTGEIRDCGLPVKDAWWASYDEDFIYLMGHGRDSDRTHTLYVLSRSYALLGQVELTNGIYFGCAASDRLYFAKGMDACTYYLDKSQIGSGPLTIKPLKIN